MGEEGVRYFQEDFCQEQQGAIRHSTLWGNSLPFFARGNAATQGTQSALLGEPSPPLSVLYTHCWPTGSPILLARG